jgi:DNA-binding NarL/FixJ family response regulator
LGIVRSGLKQLLLRLGDITVTGEAASCGEVLATLRQDCNSDLLLLEMDMPDVSGFELISCVRAQYKSLPILIYSIHKEPMIVARAFQIGASGFITKFCSQETLVEAVRKVAAGGRFIDPVLAGQVIFDRMPKMEAPHHQLSELELLILKLFAQGKNGNEVAQKLSISNQAVSAHKTNLMQKMNFNNIAELVLYATDYALID